jgi:hypothetical protein
MMAAGTDPANWYHLPVFCCRKCLDHGGAARADRPIRSGLLFHEKINLAFLIKGTFYAGEQLTGIYWFDHVTVGFGHDNTSDRLIIAVGGQENDWRTI